MTKRRLRRWSLLLVILAAFAVWLEPTRVVWGWLRGEAFYQGKPTSWWSREIQQWTSYLWVEGFPPEKTTRKVRVSAREPTSFEELLGRFVKLPEATWPTLLDGDPNGRPILQELLHDPSRFVRELAEEALSEGEPDQVPIERHVVPHSKFGIRLGFFR
jgi:hypothetical protein